MKPSLLLLHGAIGASRQLQPLAAQLTSHYDVHLFDFPGHGGTPFSHQPFSIAVFAEATLEYIRRHQLQELTIFGYSMGGYVALYLARQYPKLIGRVITLGTKFHWDEITATREVKMLDADTILQKVPAFAENLSRLHAPNDWKTILQQTAGMLQSMGQDNPLKPAHYKEIETPVLIMLGDRDKMVSFEETIAAYKGLPDARLAILPGTPHPIEQVDALLLSFFLAPVVVSVTA
ncbi:alpha/beta fold hydrolase [Chitinophaga rhizophila]|uniref:Alpha/beta fold hydrolase n=1 Tax=Chitinophaga rhizophila TaxID=2866212 RepID=A0ABS7G5H2_9BACT|nr:alpha/beta fold hydrolase [Chitinophaga rhizophila]MBW8682900.1 alpha/beta fold hydrolase [Chitinophaga rhizophila]